MSSSRTRIQQNQNRTTFILITALGVLINGCVLFNHKSREEAATACEDWVYQKSVKVFVPSGVINSRKCELEVEARRVIGSELKVEQSTKVYSEDFARENTKVAKYFRY